MGFLRLIFAVTVVLAHSWPGASLLVGGRNAVQLFYIISGFLISYVLTESKSYSSVKAFYVNRYLRIFPIYAVVATLTLGFFLATRNPDFLSVYKSAPVGGIILLAVSNVVIFFQDWVMFTGVHGGALAFSSNFRNSDVLLYNGLLVPQAWTLGIELTFYLVAPLILTRRRLMYALLTMSLLLRVYLIKSGIGTRDPWDYRFFPTEIALFLMGSLSHQILLPICRKLVAEKGAYIPAAVTLFIVVLSFAYGFVPEKDSHKMVILFPCFLLALPFAFLFQNSHRIDGIIGNLSFPIYIGHVLVLTVLQFIIGTSPASNPIVISGLCVILSIAFAWFLNQVVGVPVERLRKALKGRSKPGAISISDVMLDSPALQQKV